SVSDPPIDDGSVRVYDLSSFKVVKAVRGLSEEVSSLLCVKRPGSELRDVWLASGRRMDSPKMIQTVDDALLIIDVSSPAVNDHEDDDVLNE
ncbi:hypothetical protein H0H93_004366, partial [Arthromyces matolae]